MDGRYGYNDDVLPQPGDWAVVRTGGWFGKVIRRVTRSKVNHAFRYIGNGKIVEAAPQGTRVALLSNYPNAIWSTGKIQYTEGQRAKICHTSLKLAETDVDYSVMGVLVLGLAQYHVKNKWVADRLVRREHMFCSQEIDYVDQLADSQLFDDGRANGDVTPGDLLDLLEGRTT